MQERIEQLFQMQKLCLNELQKLQTTSENYLKNMTIMMEQLEANWKEDDHILNAYDHFLNSITSVMNSTRKFNVQLQLSNIKILEKQSLFQYEDQKSSKVTAQNLNTLYPAEEFDQNLETTEEFVYPKLNLSDLYGKNCIIQGKVTYIKNLTSLSFYILDMSSQLRETIIELSKSLDLRQYHSTPPAQEIFGYVIDQHIFRAVRSSKSFLDEELKEVIYPCYLLDTGEMVPLKSENITYRLTDDQKNTPALALLCQLETLNKNPFVGQVDLEERLKKIELENCQLKVINVLNDTLQVKFVDDNSNENDTKAININNFLKYTNPKKANQKQQLTELELEMLYEEPLCTSNAMKAVMGYDPQDDKRICRFYDPSIGGCFKGAHCKLEHTLRQPDGWTKDVLPAASLIDKRSPTTVFPFGSIINITPTFIGSPDRFYAQINDPTQTSTPLIWNNEDIPHWKLLQKPPHMFDLVLSRYTDGLWYRAKIVSHDDDYKMFKVFYVDYGNHQTVNLRDLASIDSSIAQLPYQAVLCRLDDVKEKSSITAEERKNCIQMLCKMILNVSMDVQVISHYEDLFISFLNRKEYPIPDLLLSMGFLE